MHSRRLSVSAVLLFLFCLATVCSAEQTRVIRFGHSYGENPAVIYNKYTPLLHLLSRALDCEVEFVLTGTYEEMQKAYLDGKIDMGIINAYSYLNIMDNPDLIPIAARVKAGDKNYTSLFVVRKNSSIYTIEDLENTTFAFGDPYSTSSFLVPMHYFQQLGINPAVYFRSTIQILKQDSILYSIMNRTIDGGAVASFIFNEQEETVKDKFRVIFESEPFPLGPFIVNQSLGEEIIEKTRDFLLKLPETGEGRQALLQADLAPFSTVEKSDYNWLKQITQQESRGDLLHNQED